MNVEDRSQAIFIGKKQMEEFQALTAVGQPGETEASFSSRLSSFWTGVLRNNLELFEKIYAETTEFEQEKGCPTRKYAVEPDGVTTLLEVAKSNEIAFLPPDPDETYTRHEAVAPEWWQIEH